MKYSLKRMIILSKYGGFSRADFMNMSMWETTELMEQLVELQNPKKTL
jgi:hypothetical protein